MLATKIPARKWIVIFTAAALGLQTGCTPPGPRALMRGDELLRYNKSAEAIEELKRATGLMPGEPRAWNLLGVAYHRDGQPQLAIQAYRQALSRDRSNLVAIAHYNLGCVLLEQNNAAGAADELRSYTLITNSMPGLLKLGTAQSRVRQQWDAAEQTFRTALQIDGKNAEAWNGIGIIHVHRNQRDAMQYFNAALQANPKHAPALLNSASLAQQNSATKQTALQRYRDYLAAHGTAPQAGAVKSLVRQLEMELAPSLVTPTNAMVSMNGATKTNPPAITNSRPQFAAAKSNALTTVLRTNQPVAPTSPPPAIASLPITIVAVTNQSPSRVAAAQPLAIDRPTEPPPVEQIPAIAAEPAEVSPPLITPRRDEDNGKLGFFSRLNPFRGKPKTPTNDAPRAVALNSVTATAPVVVSAPAIPAKPNFPRYTYISPARPVAGDRANAERATKDAQKAQRAGNTNQALLVYHLAIDSDPSYFDAQYYAALLAFQSGDVKRALEGWETALALEPASINARYSLALALKQANYPHDAANELERIIEAKPEEARAHLALGNIYAQQLNERAKARAHYAKFLELEPRSSQAPTIRFWLAANP